MGFRDQEAGREVAGVKWWSVEWQDGGLRNGGVVERGGAPRRGEADFIRRGSETAGSLVVD